ncbi:MAG TPA: cell envelope integrity protein TolA [Rheinheimera sp.]|nr:cell envelope integrity protein TolA [Rheinheimera sp.]
MDTGLKRALQVSASAHLLLVVLLCLNLNLFDKNEVIIVPLYSSTDAPLQATMIENPKIKEAEKPQKRKEQPKKEPPKEEPKKEEPKKEEPKKEEPKEDLIKKQQEQKEIEVKKKLEADKKKREEADIALKKKKEQDKKKKEEEEKKKKDEELKKKAAEAKKKKEQQKKLQKELNNELNELDIKDELADEADEPTRAAKQGQQLTEKQRFIAMIMERVTQNWFTDDTMIGKQCRIRLRLASNGFVTSASVEGGDPAVCQAAIVAINRVGNFPMPEDPELNELFRDSVFTFNKTSKN